MRRPIKTEIRGGAANQNSEWISAGQWQAAVGGAWQPSVAAELECGLRRAITCLFHRLFTRKRTNTIKKESRKENKSCKPRHTQTPKSAAKFREWNNAIIHRYLSAQRNNNTNFPIQCGLKNTCTAGRLPGVRKDPECNYRIFTRMLFIRCPSLRYIERSTLKGNKYNMTREKKKKEKKK